MFIRHWGWVLGAEHWAIGNGHRALGIGQRAFRAFRAWRIGREVGGEGGHLGTTHAPLAQKQPHDLVRAWAWARARARARARVKG